MPLILLQNANDKDKVKAFSLIDVVLGRVDNAKLRDAVCRKTPYELLEKRFHRLLNEVKVCCLQNSFHFVSDFIIVSFALLNQKMEKQTKHKIEDTSFLEEQKVGDIVALARILKVKSSSFE